MTRDIRTADDLLAAGYENDPLLADTRSLCTACTISYRTVMAADK